VFWRAALIQHANRWQERAFQTLWEKFQRSCKTQGTTSARCFAGWVGAEIGVSEQ